MKRFFRIFLFVIASVLLSNAAYLWIVSNFNLGLLLLTGLGATVLIYALFTVPIHALLDNPIGRIIKCIIVLIAAFFVFTSSVIATSAIKDTVSFNEDAVIVLGAGIHGEAVSKVLAYRLDAAVEYHQNNPRALIIVSGGQGPQELITEAEAMERYLIKKGVNLEVIVREDKATSTYENFLYSKKILDETFSDEYKVAFISNGFHLYRAGRLANSAGLRVQKIQAKSSILTLLPDYLRECCAVGVMWLKG